VPPVCGVDDHCRRSRATLDSLAVQETVAAREVVVEQEHVGTRAVELRELGGRRRCRDHRQVGLGVDEPSQARQHGGMVIQDRDAKH
jgi:hypothetical protein